MCKILLCKVLAVLLLLLVFAITVGAEVRGFSRANCIAWRNESITWNAPWDQRWYWTSSYHCINGRIDHWLAGKWKYGAYNTEGDWDWPMWWRWQVIGLHYHFKPYFGTIQLPWSTAWTCNAWNW